MRKFLLAAAAFSAIAGATAMAQNASPNNPGNGPAVDDKMNSPAPQGGAMGANPTPTAPANAPPRLSLKPCRRRGRTLSSRRARTC